MRILFVILASLGVLSALGVVLARNLVHAALFLVAFFFLVACQFVLLEAEFMAAMQVLVYIGAVSIILMFGIMLTRNIQGDETTGGHWSRKVPAALVALALLAVLVVGIVEQKGAGGTGWSGVTSRPAAVVPSADGRAEAINDMGRHVGLEMMRRFLIPFEVAGLLLTAALVGAIALAQSEEPDAKPRFGATADMRGGTTREPRIGLDEIGNGSPPPAAGASLTASKLHPASDPTRP